MAVAQSGVCLHSMHEALASIPTCHKQDVVAHSCKPGALEVEIGGCGVQGQPHLHSTFKASLSYVRLS